MRRQREAKRGRGSSPKRTDPDGPDRHLAAIQGDFISVTDPGAARSHVRPRQSSPARLRCRSPEGRPLDQGVHLHLSLTDSQMDKLTSAFSAGSPSPEQTPRRLQGGAKASARDVGLPSTETARNSDASPQPAFDHPFTASPRRHARSCSPQRRSPDRHGPSHPTAPAFGDCSPSIAERRWKPLPSPINLQLARQYGRASYAEPTSSSSRQPQDSLADTVSPETPRREHARRSGDVADAPSSQYSDDSGWSTMPHYTNPRHPHELSEVGGAPDGSSERWPGVLRDYVEWARPEPAPAVASRDPEEHVSLAGAGASDTYSPLGSLFRGAEQPTSRRGRKVLVGYNGWLERTGKAPVQTTPPPKKPGLLDTLKKVAKDIVDRTDMGATRRAREAERGGQAARLRISLDPREQSLIYCEMEFILTSAMDSYINSQLNAGRLGADKYKKVADGWQQKGRPRVVGFRYDLETQLELVRLHLLQFKFYGERAGNAAAVAGVLDMMKVNARAMRIRTFCQPDPVIAKQLLDSQSLFDVLGCPESQQIQLAEIVQFFKTVLEREKHFGAHLPATVGNCQAPDDESPSKR